MTTTGRHCSCVDQTAVFDDGSFIDYKRSEGGADISDLKSRSMMAMMSVSKSHDISSGSNKHSSTIKSIEGMKGDESSPEKSLRQAMTLRRSSNATNTTIIPGLAALAAQTASERQRTLLERTADNRKLSDDYEARAYAISDAHFGTRESQLNNGKRESINSSKTIEADSDDENEVDELYRNRGSLDSSNSFDNQASPVN